MADFADDRDGAVDIPPAPLAGTRGEAVQRLQIGLAGLAAMVLLVGLASIILERANEAEALTVPEAAATVSPAPTAQSDPLADTGVVPDLPADPTTAPAQAAPILPEQGRTVDNGQ